MLITESSRLRLRTLALTDAAFICELYNDPEFIAHIGDRGIKTLSDARRFITSGPLESYKIYGYGLYVVEMQNSRQPIGTCGLLKRDMLDMPDIGYSFLPAFRGKGYAYEAAKATLEYGRNVLGLEQIVGIVSPENLRSIHLLKKLGMVFECYIQLTDTDDRDELFVLSNRSTNF